MTGFLGKILIACTFMFLVNSQEIVRVPSTELVYNIQRSLTLPMTLLCPIPNYKFIEVRGVTLANDSNVIVASSRFPNIDRVTNEECLASLSETADKRARCGVSMKNFAFDDVTKKMDKVVMFDCRKNPGGDSAGEIKTISKKKGTINIKCPNKDAVPKVMDISLASGKYVDVTEVAWKCSEENIKNMGKGNGGGHCQIKREQDLNKSEMTVKYKCSSPPRRDIDEFIQKGNGKNKQKKQ